jgi:hypothetical protein
MAQHFDPKSFQMTDKEKEEAAKNQQPPPMPQIEVAKIRDAGETQRLDKKLAHEAQQGDMDRALEKLAIEIDGQLGAANLSLEERVALNDAKVTLAGITMKLRTQQTLSAMKGPQVITPPTEPAGKAPAGQAYQQ